MVFVDVSETDKLMTSIKITIYLVSMLFNFWVTTQLLTPVTSREFRDWYDWNSNQNININQAAEYKARFENVIKASKYASFYEFKGTVINNDGSRAEIHPLQPIESLIKYMQDELTTILPHVDSEIVNEVNLSGVSEGEFSMF